MNRRYFLLSSAGVGLVAATGATTFALTRAPTTALAPWSEAGRSTADPRRFVIEHAVLAPNPHNRQPWIVELTGPTTMTLWCDLDRRLPATDPFDRQIVIGLGCFTEIASLAAGILGYRLDVTPFPEGEPAPRLDRRPIARLALVSTPGLGADPLAAWIKVRRSTRQPFDMNRAVPAQLLAAIAGQSGPLAEVSTLADPARVATVRALTWEAWEVEAATARTHRESVDLMRIGRREIEANPDGIALRGPFLEALALLGQISREQIADTSTAAFRQGVDMYRAMLAATPAYCLVVAPDQGRAGEFAAGRAYLRACLAAAAAGLTLHPVSQALQEFAEMADVRRRLEAALGIPASGRLHMLARLGYGPAVPPAPRWAAATRIRST